MEQVRQISQAVQPNYTFLVIDAMTGQDAVGVAEAFHATLAIDGVIMSKLDGDARTTAARRSTLKEVIGRPITFASTGEKLNEFEQFHPDRMAGRILGMGDMLSLIEQAEQAFEKDAGRGRCREDDGGGVHPRRLPRTDAGPEEDGPARQPPRDDAGPYRQGAEGGERSATTSSRPSKRSSAR